MRKLKLFLMMAVLLMPVIAQSEPQNFRQAKIAIKQSVFHDQNKNGANGTIYCGCDWKWVGESGGRVDHSSCGYKVRAIPNRAARTEVEHVVPASWLGSQRQCWKNGGRKNCNATDPIFNLMEANTHNLDISVGEVNADRSAYRFGMLPNAPAQYGQCASRVDFKQRVFEPRDEAKGLVARINFYMHDRYNLSMSQQQQQLFMAWDKQYPPSAWERERDKRNAKIMGHSNPFVTGERRWSLGHRNSGDGLNAAPVRTGRPSYKQHQQSSAAPATQSASSIKGNKNSKIYHVKNSCPSFSDVSERNSVYFKSEQEAVSQGFRKARNCK